MRLFCALSLLLTLLITGCGQGGALSGPSDTNRGDSGANKPAQGATIVNTCEDTRRNGADSGGTTINNTNNCNKNNPSTVEGAAQ